MNPRRRTLYFYLSLILLVTVLTFILFRLPGNWASNKDTIELIVALATFAALVLAVDGLTRLRRITRSLSTSYAGLFPNHLRKITEIIDGARDSIIIFTDCVDYGSFSEPRLHKHLLDAILSALAPSRKTRFARIARFVRGKSRSVDVTFLVWGKPQLISNANRMHAANTGSPEFVRTVQRFVGGLEEYQPEFVEGHRAQFDRLKAFADDDTTNWNNEGAKSACSDVQDALHAWEVALLRERGAKVEGQYFPNTRRSMAFPTNGMDAPQVDFFFWLIDFTKAVVLFLDSNKDAIAFVTQEAELLRLLENKFDEKFLEATGRRWPRP